MRKALLGIVLMLLVAGFLCWTTARLPSDILNALEATPSLISTPVPNYTLDGVEVDNLFQLVTDEVQAVIVVVWDTNCPYCKQELLYLHNVYVDQPEIMIIAQNPYDDEDSIRQYINENGLSSIIVVIGDLSVRPVGVPLTTVYTRDGILLGQFFGWDKERSPAHLTEILTIN